MFTELPAKIPDYNHFNNEKQKLKTNINTTFLFWKLFNNDIFVQTVFDGSYSGSKS